MMIVASTCSKCLAMWNARLAASPMNRTAKTISNAIAKSILSGTGYDRAIATDPWDEACSLANADEASCSKSASPFFFRQ
jgi:hypothetical protein